MFYVMFVLGFYFTNRRDDLGPLFWPLASCIALRAVVESFRLLFFVHLLAPERASTSDGIA